MNNNFDLYQLPQYNFYFNDSMYVSTWCGAFVTLLLLLIVLIVTFGKFEQFSSKDASVLNIHKNIQHAYFD